LPRDRSALAAGLPTIKMSIPEKSQKLQYAVSYLRCPWARASTFSAVAAALQVASQRCNGMAGAVAAWPAKSPACASGNTALPPKLSGHVRVTMVQFEFLNEFFPLPGPAAKIKLRNSTIEFDYYFRISQVLKIKHSRNEFP